MLLLSLGFLLVFGCVPKKQLVDTQSQVTRLQQDSLRVARFFQTAKDSLVTEQISNQWLEQAQLEMARAYLEAQKGQLEAVIEADSLRKHLAYEAIQRDLLRIRLLEAKKSETLLLKKSDSLRLEVEFLKIPVAPKPKPATKPTLKKPSVAMPLLPKR